MGYIVSGSSIPNVSDSRQNQNFASDLLQTDVFYEPVYFLPPISAEQPESYSTDHRIFLSRAHHGDGGDRIIGSNGELLVGSASLQLPDELSASLGIELQVPSVPPHF